MHVLAVVEEGRDILPRDPACCSLRADDIASDYTDDAVLAVQGYRLACARQVYVVEVEVKRFVNCPTHEPGADCVHRSFALEEELSTLVVVDGVGAFVDAVVVGEIFHIAKRFYPLQGC
ncbi:MAG: hypothetical protein MH213_16000 [Marinobacter sp.]|nr:hypothetical protein [Marinobacter sp.]